MLGGLAKLGRALRHTQVSVVVVLVQLLMRISCLAKGARLADETGRTDSARARGVSRNRKTAAVRVMSHGILQDGYSVRLPIPNFRSLTITAFHRNYQLYTI